MTTQAERRFDLHMHSRHSDGTDSVSELVRLVGLQGLAGFSLTDHDTSEGQVEAQNLALGQGLEYITGIELSLSQGDRDIHLLVYRFDPRHPELVERLAHFRRIRRERFYAMVLKLSLLGIELDLQSLGPQPEGGSLGRPHLARLLIEQGKVGGMREAFERFLAVGKPAYVPKAMLHPEDGIALGRSAGGVTVLAHPGSYPFEPELGPLVDVGLQGVETTYPSWDQSTTAFWQAQARKHNLLETGGSDYHGGNRSHVKVGDATVDESDWARLLTA